MLVDPVGESLMELGTSRFRDGVVSSVSDEQMAEAKTLVTRYLRAVRANELAANERSQPCSHPLLLRRERPHGAAMEHLPFDCRGLEHATLRGFELIKTCSEERLEGWASL